MLRDVGDSKQFWLAELSLECQSSFHSWCTSGINWPMLAGCWSCLTFNILYIILCFILVPIQPSFECLTFENAGLVPGMTHTDSWYIPYRSYQVCVWVYGMHGFSRLLDAGAQGKNTCHGEPCRLWAPDFCGSVSGQVFHVCISPTKLLQTWLHIINLSIIHAHLTHPFSHTSITSHLQISYIIILQKLLQWTHELIPWHLTVFHAYIIDVPIQSQRNLMSKCIAAPSYTSQSQDCFLDFIDTTSSDASSLSPQELAAKWQIFRPRGAAPADEEGGTAVESFRSVAETWLICGIPRSTKKNWTEIPNAEQPMSILTNDMKTALEGCGEVCGNGGGICTCFLTAGTLKGLKREACLCCSASIPFRQCLLIWTPRAGSTT